LAHAVVCGDGVGPYSVGITPLVVQA